MELEVFSSCMLVVLNWLKTFVEDLIRQSKKLRVLLDESQAGAAITGHLLLHI